LTLEAADHQRIGKYRFVYDLDPWGLPRPYRRVRRPDGRFARQPLLAELTNLSRRDKERRPFLVDPESWSDYTRPNLRLIFRDYPRPRPYDSLYRGVSYSSDLESWRAELILQDRYWFFGYHTTAKLAARAYYLGVLDLIQSDPEIVHLLPL
jgi:hypothetical protein